MTVTLVARNAAWWHQLFANGESLQGPGYLFAGPVFELGRFEAGDVITFNLESYNPRPPHQSFGSAAHRLSGSYPTFICSFEDGHDNDFNDIVIKIQIFPELPCPTEDPILDTRAIRDEMMALLDASGIDGNPEDRREQSGYIHRLADGTLKLIPAPNPGPATPCSGIPRAPDNQPGDEVVGAFHTHPFAHGDVLPPNCNLPFGATYDNKRLGGGSRQDWNFAPDFAIPMYIIDMEEVFRLDPNTPISERGNNPNRWAWNKIDSCTWR